jgi:hypothetical protein
MAQKNAHDVMMALTRGDVQRCFTANRRGFGIGFVVQEYGHNIGVSHVGRYVKSGQPGLNNNYQKQRMLEL